MQRPGPGKFSKLPLALAAISVILSCIALSVLLFSKSEEIVYVDAQKLVNGYKGMQDARSEFENKTLVWKSNLDTLRAEAEATIKEYEASDKY